MQAILRAHLQVSEAHSRVHREQIDSDESSRFGLPENPVVNVPVRVPLTSRFRASESQNVDPGESDPHLLASLKLWRSGPGVKFPSQPSRALIFSVASMEGNRSIASRLSQRKP